ncbi:hypothetical protein O181_018978 [Austropuccinia psidii MF-1]|uniref:Uncharacterized protein n=1 Tax=Austropuccinia psidii MF-1 TaxID=1389203 RepID=A0A9Q3CA34_9BASI|nr:hypothetical protein [Austropuccinia psidii MF-1]
MYGIDINKYKDIYSTIGENERQILSFSNIPKQISVVSSNKETHKEEIVSKKLSEAKFHPELSSKMKQELINLLCTYKNAFSSDNKPLGTIRGTEVEITLNIDIPYPPVLRSAAYQEDPRVRKAL